MVWRRLASAAFLACGLVAATTGCDGDAPAATPSGGGGAQAPFPRADVLLISLDTCRGDVLGAYGGPAGISPALDAFAREAIVFEHARAQAPHTAPSHMSLFTSLYPSVHGVQNVQHGKDPDTGRSLPLIEPLPDAIPTWAELLTAAGYTTVGLTDGGNLNPNHGFQRGFERYTHDLSGAEAQVAEGVAALHELVAAGNPFFLFWHTYEIHAPYVSPRRYLDNWAPESYEGPVRERVESLEGLDFRQRFARMRTDFWRDKESFSWAESAYMHGLYRAGVKYTDDALGALFAALRDLRVFDDAIVIVLSDHGEEFFEHGKWQHDQLFEETLRVPLMVRLPGGVGAGTRIATPVALVDVLPTVLELIGVEPGLEGATSPMQGVALTESLLTGAEPRARPILSEVRSDREGGPLYDWMVAFHHNGLKFIYDEHRSDAGKGVEQLALYDLAADPDEQRDVSDEQASILARFLELRADYLAELEVLEPWLGGSSEDAKLDCDQLRQLVELGYLDASGLDDCDD